MSKRADHHAKGGGCLAFSGAGVNNYQALLDGFLADFLALRILELLHFALMLFLTARFFGRCVCHSLRPASVARWPLPCRLQTFAPATGGENHDKDVLKAPSRCGMGFMAASSDANGEAGRRLFCAAAPPFEALEAKAHAAIGAQAQGLGAIAGLIPFIE